MRKGSEVEELKPCPFCGSQGQVNDHVLKTMSGHYTADAQCSSCDNVTIDQVYAASSEEAVKGAAAAWNTRRLEPLVWSSEPTKAGRWLVEYTDSNGRSEEYVQTLDEDEIGLPWTDGHRFAFIPEPKETAK